MCTHMAYSCSWPWLQGLWNTPTLARHGNKVPRIPLCELEKGTCWVNQLYPHGLGGLCDWMTPLAG